ncbi:hypothetical protein K501DRAFT_334091 [Backusella circina FSU 941]|nr:hypothetical protein K501DRAFT_334091 [Backusella circina FSU 941]
MYEEKSYQFPLYFHSIPISGHYLQLLFSKKRSQDHWIIASSFLPVEVVLSISHLLSFHDRLSLIKTCSKLKGMLEETTLYEQLIILGSKSRTVKIIARFQSRQLNGNQVKRLHLDAGILDNELFKQLPTIFPNVTHYSSLACHHTRLDDAIFSLLQWKTTLETFDTGDQSFEFERLLETHTFSRLVSLRITPYFISGDIGYHTGLDMIQCLVHTPSLKQLTLHHCEITLGYLEHLHAACPQLKSLVLQGLMIQTNGETLSLSMEPAHLVSLTVDSDVLICDKAVVFLDYIIAKYRRLVNLEFMSNAKEWELDYLCGKMYLDNIGEIYIDQDELDTALEEQRDDFELTQRNYQCQGDRLLSYLPSTLETLRLDTTYFENIMYALDKSSINPISLEFYQNDKESFHVFNGADELAYLQQWMSLKILRVTVDSAMQAYNHDTASTSIVKLNITVKGDVACNMVDFGWFLAVFPSLEELELHFSGTVFVGVNVDIEKTYPNLQTLKIECGSASPILEDILHIITPNLKSLIVTKY